MNVLRIRTLSLCLSIILVGAACTTTDAENTNSSTADTISLETTSTGLYTDYSAAAVTEAQSNGKYVLLFFYADWCPTCKVQDPIMTDLFNSLPEDSNVVAFRTDYDTEKELKKQYSITLQHSFVLLAPNGEVLTTFVGQNTQNQLLEIIEEYL